MPGRMNMPPVGACVLTVVLASTLAFSLQLGQKPPDDAFDKDYPVRGDIVQPRMLTMRGCSGSSAVMIFARHLLRYHGIPVPSAEMPHQDSEGNAAPPRSYGWPDEMLKENVNWFFKKADEDWGKAMEMAYEDVKSQNQTMFFKGMIDEINDEKVWAQIKPSFQRMRVLPVLGFRRNMLDQVICQVNDCFHQEYGVPVDAGTGERSHLCFKRRDVEGKSIAAQNDEKKADSRALAEHLETHVEIEESLKKHDAVEDMFADEQLKKGNAMHFLLKGDYMAQLDPSHIITSIEREYESVRLARNRLEAAGFHFKEVSAEDLLDFEADLGALERGVNAYVDLLESFGVDADKVIVRQYLEQFAQTYPKPDKHSALIYNFDEVKNVLQGTKYEQFIRQ